MRYAVVLIIFCLPLCTKAQNLNCYDFIEGTFKSTVPQFPGVVWEIIRTKSSHKEYPLIVPEKYKKLGFPMDTIYSNLKQIDSCSYNLKYDDKKMELDKGLKSMNELGGISVKIIEIKKRCFFYESTFFINQEEVKVNGTICKE